MAIILNAAYWDNRYKISDDRWDLGAVSPPIKNYLDQLEDKSLKILIPGCGNAHEAEYAFLNGFTNLHVVDLSETALKNFKKRVPNFPENQLLQQNFFKLKDTFDLIIEQTFFCAINPELRPEYAAQASNLLTPTGKIAGLLFDAPLNNDKPPFGGNIEEYKTYFNPYFTLNTIASCYNSVESRAGRELFITFTKK